jgi:putative acetyltransferase
MVVVRPESPPDRASVRVVNERAFPTHLEAHIVDAVRDRCADVISLVAEVDGRVAGHILFSPVHIDGARGRVDGMGLAPMAVLPGYQRQGIGSALVRAGLDLLRARGCPFVVVLGHPEYYPRFGFERASRLGVVSQWRGVPNEAFMVLALSASPDQLVGTAYYRDEFDVSEVDEQL